MTRQDRLDLAENTLAWAHQGMALVDRRISESLSASGVRTQLLVDADIVVTQAYPYQQKRLFRSLFRKHNSTEDDNIISAAVGPYFFQHLFSEVGRDKGTFGDSWWIAPEHFAEVVHHAKTKLGGSESFDTDSNAAAETEIHDHDRPSQSIEGLLTLLERLKKDPWAPIRREMAELLSNLGVSTAKPSNLSVVRILLEFVKSNASHVIGFSPRKDADYVQWPSFKRFAETDLVLFWRAILRGHSREAHAIEHDARVLAALCILNRDWRRTGKRVVLVTGSMYILQAVKGRSLFPQRDLPEQAGAFSDEYGHLLSDFIRVPTCVLSSEKLWNPVDLGDGRDMTEFLAPSDPSSVALARSQYFSVVATEADSLVAEEGITTRFEMTAAPQHTLNFLRDRFSTNVALRQIAREFAEKRLQDIDAAANSIQGMSTLGELEAHIREFEEVASVRYRVDLLEWLIASDHAQRSSHPSSPSQNKLRHSPFVDFADPRYQAACDLRAALLASAESDTKIIRERVNALKVDIYKQDPTTYLLVLVYADLYARQGRWGLARSAARYAYRLSQTSRYDENSRTSDIYGEEAALLDLACQRRGAMTLPQARAALDALTEYEKTLQGEDVRLTKERIAIERLSIELTCLSFEFFLNEEPQISAFREKANHLLEGAIDHLREFLAHRNLVREPPTNLLPAESDVYHRYLVNICNLAWMSVAWSFSELRRTRVLSPRRDRFVQWQSGGALEEVRYCVCTLAGITGLPRPSDGQFDWLAWVLCTLVLGLPEVDSLGVSVECVQSDFGSLGKDRYDHPYDNLRVEYAQELAMRLHR